jgi:hypothetical protein
MFLPVPVTATSTADWIQAGATVGAAIGTVGAVIVALWQSARRDRRILKVDCALMGIADDSGSYLRVLATNDGHRPVRLRFPPTFVALANDGKTRIAYGVEALDEKKSDSLPRTLEDGDSVMFVYDYRQMLQFERAQNWRGFESANIQDVLGNRFDGAYVGVKTRRRLPWRPPKYVLPQVRLVPTTFQAEEADKARSDEAPPG